MNYFKDAVKRKSSQPKQKPEYLVMERNFSNLETLKLK